MLKFFKPVWKYRQFVVTSIRNEFVTPFARSKLGALWILLNPLAQVAIYALVLSNVLSARLPGIDNRYAYAVYLMAGLLGWNLFTEIISRCLTIFIHNSQIIKKIQFPLMTLPVITVGICLLNNIIVFLSMCLIFLIVDHQVTLNMLWLLPVTVLTVLFATSLGLMLGIMSVFIRDITQIVPIVMQIVFWFTPIVYPVNIIPEKYRALLSFNPIYELIRSYQVIILYGDSPHLANLLPILVISVGLFAGGLVIFKRALPDILDSI